MATRRLVIAANLIYAVAVLVLGLIPTFPVAVAGVSDGVAHAAAYAVQTVLLYGLFMPSAGRIRAALLAVGVAVLYGGCVEILQLLQPARTVETADLVANMVGSGVAALFLYLVTSSGSKGVGR